MKTAGKVIRGCYKGFVGFGIMVIGVMTVMVIMNVILRYFFNITFTWLEELVAKIFVLSTFWGIGICIVGDEHINIDYFYNKLPPKIIPFVKVFNFLVMLAVLVMMCVMSFKWIKTVGDQMPIGLRVPSKYLYLIMPVSLIFAMPCTIYKIWETIRDSVKKNLDMKAEKGDSTC